MTSLIDNNQPAGLGCDENWDTTVAFEVQQSSSKKRIRKKIDRIGKNIKQRMMFALFDKEHALV